MNDFQKALEGCDFLLWECSVPFIEKLRIIQKNCIKYKNSILLFILVIINDCGSFLCFTWEEIWDKGSAVFICFSSSRFSKMSDIYIKRSSVCWRAKQAMNGKKRKKNLDASVGFKFLSLKKNRGEKIPSFTLKLQASWIMINGSVFAELDGKH